MTPDFGRILDVAPTPLVLLDRDLQMVWMNQAYLEVTGRRRDQLVGRRMLEAFPNEAESDSDRMLRASLARALSTGQTDHLAVIPYPIEGPDGQMRHRIWSATHVPVRDEEGRVAFVLQNTMDVTDVIEGHGTAPPRAGLTRQAEIVRRSEAVSRENLALGVETSFLKRVFDQAPSFVAVLQGPEHRFQLANSAYLRLTGLEPDIIGHPVREVLKGLQDRQYFELLDHVFSTGEPFVATAAPVALDRPGGERQQLHVDLICQPMRDEHGAITGIFVQGHDVSAEHQAQEAAQESESRFRTMADAMPNNIWLTTPEGEVEWFNREIARYTGRTPEELNRLGWQVLLHPDDLPHAGRIYEQMLAGGTRMQFEARLRSVNGEFRWHLFRVAPVHGAGGRLLRWVGTSTDIHDRIELTETLAAMNATLEARVEARRNELEEAQAALRQSQRMEAVGNLAGGIAHDFNNLLQVVAGSIQLALRDDALAERNRERLDHAMAAVMRGSTLASQLLAFGRRQPLQPRTLSLARLVGEAERLLRSTLGDGIRIRTLLGPDLWNVFVDATNLENALLNLAINARDAMEGHGELQIRLENRVVEAGTVSGSSEARPGEYVLLAVSDTGSGMTPEIREKVFEPFFTTKPEGRGTGLGLSMVYGFVRQTGGFVQIDSTPGLGTTMELYLPRSVLPEERRETPVPAGVRGGTERVLLVEDDDDVRRTSLDLLADLGYSVTEAVNADAAMALLDAGHRFDVLFTDVMMPGRLRARDLALRAQALDPSLAVLFTSGYTEDEITHDGRLDPGVTLLSKPYSRETLAAKLREVIETESPPTLAAPARAPLPADPQAPLAGLQVLVVEDDPIIRMNMEFELEDWGAQVLGAGSAQGALDQLGPEVALLLVDVGLPDMAGTELARLARQRVPELPVIFATGNATVETADELGRASVLTKPFTGEMLLQAIREALAIPA